MKDVLLLLLLIMIIIFLIIWIIRKVFALLKFVVKGTIFAAIIGLIILTVKFGPTMATGIQEYGLITYFFG